MTAAKTVETTPTVSDLLSGLEPKQRKSCRTVAKLMRKATGARAKMWGSSIVGFGKYHYVYASGRQGNCFLIGFSPRKTNLTIYVMDGFEKHQALMKKLGSHKTGKSCLYIKHLDGIDLEVLQELIKRSVATMRQRYP